MRRISAPPAPADHDVDRTPVVLQALEEQAHLGQVELQVAVREADQIAARVVEAGAQRAAVAEVRLVVDAYPGIVGGDRIGQLAGPIGGAIIDDEHLHRRHEWPDVGERTLHGGRDVLLLVEGGEEEGQVRADRGCIGRIGHDSDGSFTRCSFV